jgi:ABC-2 type transport system ATP-binding protein
VTSIESPDIVIEADDLSKSFGGVQAVKNLSFKVQRGEVCGLLGPNGAGKTTSVRMLVGLIRPDTGSASLLGERMRPGHPVLRHVGLLVERPAFVPYLSGMRNLRLHWGAGGDKWPPPALDEALDLADLGDAIHRKVKGYSQGMRQRLGLAQAMMNAPALLVLDEPTNGLDPAETRRIRVAMGDISARGTTVLLSSHLLAEVEQMCSDALVIDHGTLVAAGTVADLVGSSKAVELEVDDAAKARTVLERIDGVLGIDAGEPVDHRLVVQLNGIARSEIVRALVLADVRVETAMPRRRLEDAYLSLVEHDG